MCSGATGDSRSVSPEKESLASDSAGRASSTTAPRSLACRTASSQSVVLPIPGSPRIASARSPRSLSARNASTTAISDSRPTTDDTARA